MSLDAKLDSIRAQREAFEKEFASRLEALKAEEEKLAKLASKKDKIIETVKALGVDPVILGEILFDAELIKIATPARAGGAVDAKYRHPQDHSKVWSGRGKRPVWINDYIAGNDAKLAELLISNQQQQELPNT